MLSGKPPRPWKRKRRGVSVARIALLVLLLGAAAAYGLWRLRPTPTPWQPVGAERIVTPAFDIADERSRRAARFLSALGADGLGASCSAEGPHESYVISRSGRLGEPWWNTSATVRITAVFDALGRGEIVREEGQWNLGGPVGRERRVLDVDEGERFRDLLIQGGFTEQAPAGSLCPDHPGATIESCIGGRYYGVLSGCGEDPESVHRLVEAIDAFARDGATPWPHLRPSSTTTPTPDPEVDSPAGAE